MPMHLCPAQSFPEWIPSPLIPKNKSHIFPSVQAYKSIREKDRQEKERESSLCLRGIHKLGMRKKPRRNEGKYV